MEAAVQPVGVEAEVPATTATQGALEVQRVRTVRLHHAEVPQEARGKVHRSLQT